MRLKTFTATTLKDAITEVRKALGPDAIIVSSQTLERGKSVKVIAAVEAPANAASTELPNPAPASTLASTPQRHTPQETAPVTLESVFDHHGLPAALCDTLARTAGSVDAETSDMALAAALDMTCRFMPLTIPQPRPVMLVGMPGAGKTSAIAKLAAAALIDGRAVRIFTTDTERTGGIGQLQGYGSLLDQTVTSAASADELVRAVARSAMEKPDLVLIDSAGINPYAKDDLAQLNDLAKSVDAEPVAVMAAGGDSLEAMDIGLAFARLGVQRFIGTRLDTARRFGSLLAFAHAGPLAFSCVSATPYIGDGLQPLNPVSLARLLMAVPATRTTKPFTRLATL